MLKPSAIVAAREEKLKQWLQGHSVPVAMSLGSGSQQQPSVNTPEAAVFTIVSWNIQDFHESKVYANPFVNAVIKQVIRAISADLVVIIESQLAPSTIVAGVEHEYTNPIGTDWEAEDGAEETEEQYLQRVAAAADTPMPDYYGIGSETTQKRQEPPAQFLGSDISASYWTADQASPWKSYYSDEIINSVAKPLPLKKFYSIHDTATGRELTGAEINGLTAAHKSHIDFRLRGGPMTLDEAGALSNILIELGVFKADKESYALLFAWKRDPVEELPVMPGRDVQAQGKQVWVDGAHARLVYKDTAGKDAGFQTPNVVTKNFRAPYLVPMAMTLMSGQRIELPFLAFHAPWEGGSVPVRTEAFTSILAVDVALPANPPAPLAVKDFANVIIVGDFNLEHKTGKSGPARAFAEYDAAGFMVLNQGGKTSLKELFKKKTDILQATLNYNYDHILVKGPELQDARLQAGVIDVQGHLADYVAECKQNNTSPPLNEEDQHDVTAWKDYTNEELGRYIYRKYVSDHLPVFVDFVVAKTPQPAPMEVSPAALPLPGKMIRTEIAVNIQTAELLPGVGLTSTEPRGGGIYEIIALVVGKFAHGVYVVAPHPVRVDLPIAIFIGAQAAETLRVGRYIHLITEFEPQPRGMKEELLLPFEPYLVFHGEAFTNATVLAGNGHQAEMKQLEQAERGRPVRYAIRGRVAFVSKKLRRIWIVTMDKRLIDLPQADSPNELHTQQWVELEAPLIPGNPTLAPKSYSQ